MTGPIEEILPWKMNTQNNSTTNESTSSSDKWCKLFDIPVHGGIFTVKANNMIRILFENVDGRVVPDKTLKNNNNKNTNNHN